MYLKKIDEVVVPTPESASADLVVAAPKVGQALSAGIELEAIKIWHHFASKPPVQRLNLNKLNEVKADHRQR